jgi:hypothetical protein
MSQPPDVIAEIMSLLTPDRLLRDPRADGHGVSVAIIDSGIERAVLESRFRARGITIANIEGGLFTGDGTGPLPYTGHQSSPHGTTVADIILALAPAARLYSADVFGSRGTCDVEVVIKALRWATDVWKCKVINLSLGVAESRLVQVQRRYQLLRAIEQCYLQDVVIVAAAHNDHPMTHSYPAMFAPPLLSVDKQLFADPLQFAYHLRGGIEFQAHSRGYFGPFASEPATSWAAPHLAGIAARLVSLRPDLKPFEIKTLLYWLWKRGRQ